MPQDHILVVEDDPEMAAVLRDSFEQESLTVHVAQDGGVALRLARANRLQAVVLGVMLPVMDGYAVARDLRSQRDRTPILMLTARNAVADIVNGLESGVDDYPRSHFHSWNSRHGARTDSAKRR